MSRRVVIIGNGISGVTAARFIRKRSDAEITIISDETDYFYSRTALMYIYMGHMRYVDTKPYEDDFWRKNDIRTLRGYVESIDTEARRLRLRDGGLVAYDVLLIATGSKSNVFEWPGTELDGVQGLYGIPDLEKMEAATEDVDHAVVVGGGLIGIEMVEMLHSRHIPVTFLVREDSYMDYVLPSEESALVNEEIRRHGIDLRLATELKEIRGDGEGRARSVVTQDGEEIPCQFVGLTVGVHPNTNVAADTQIEINRGVLVDAFFATNVEGVYAIGDCAEFREDGIGSKRVEQLWYTGRKHGKTVAATVCGEPTPYDPGPFFNSAKFFTIEWQTYGRIQPAVGSAAARTQRDDADSVPSDDIPTLEERTSDTRTVDTQTAATRTTVTQTAAAQTSHTKTIVWQDGRRLVRIDYDDESVRGFNTLGVRLRHAVCERWLREGRSIDYVLQRLPEADFDPEFEARHARKRDSVFSSMRG